MRLLKFPYLSLSAKRNMGQNSYRTEQKIGASLRPSVFSQLRAGVLPQFKAALVPKMVKRANVSFLWTSLGLHEIMGCNTEEDMDDTLNSMPEGMDDLYRRMINTAIANSKSKPRGCKLGQRILTWAICCRRPLALDELRQALEPDFALITDIELIISRVCGQLVFVDPVSNRLTMLHEAARDHILTTKSELGVNVALGHQMLFTKCLSFLEENRNLPRELSHQQANAKVTLKNGLFYYAMKSWAYHLGKVSIDSDEPLLLLTRFLKGNYVLDWIVALALTKQLRSLVSSAKAMNLYVRRKRGRYEATNPMSHCLEELRIVELWATDLLNLVGKFSLHLIETPISMYQLIPPFCPRSSMIYQQLEKSLSPGSQSLIVEGRSSSTWDNGLAKISLHPATNSVSIKCARDTFAILTGGGMATLYSSTTFETRTVLRHAEEVSAIAFSSKSHLLVTYGYRSTKVWSVESGRLMHKIQNPIGSSVKAIKFASKDTKVMIGSSDRLLRVANLKDSAPAWSTLYPQLLKTDPFGRPAYSAPWRMAFNANANCIAVSYRTTPMAVWSLDTQTLLGRCLRNNEDTGRDWAVVDQMTWHPNSEEIIGLYLGGQVFRWNPYTNGGQELEAEGSILACSSEGKFFAVGDSQGTIKLYNFNHFSMIYKTSYDQLIAEICFSPDSTRLYDIRGAWCNIWEPNALLSGEESTDDSDLSSEAASLPSAMVCDASAQVRPQIKAIAVHPGGRYYAIANEAGIINLVDPSSANSEPFELWRPPLELPTTKLDWSSDGTHLACIEMMGIAVVSKVSRDEHDAWSANLVFSTRVDVSLDGAQQILLNSNASMIMIKNGPSITTQSVQLVSATHCSNITRPDTLWVKHPGNPDLLLCFAHALDLISSLYVQRRHFVI